MAYKGEYRPSELLCPNSYKWIPLDGELKKQVGKIQEESIRNATNDLFVDLSNKVA